MYGTVIFVAIVFAIVRSLLKRLHPTWWSRRAVRVALWVTFASAAFGILLRTWAMSAWVPGQTAVHARSPASAIVGVMLSAPGAVVLLALFLTLPLAALVRAIASAALLRRPGSGPAAGAPAAGEAPAQRSPVETHDAGEATDAGPGPSPSPEPAAATSNARVMLPRRRLVEVAAATLPVAALGAAGVGVAGAFAATRIVPRPMRFAGLPAELEGLRILQLTDLHIGAFMDLEGVDALVEAARPHRPDLVVMTGDIADHVPWLPDTLRMVASLAPRFGAFAALGNHEHFRGLESSIAAYAKSEVDLLMNEARRIRVGGSELIVAGVDDPGRGLGGAGPHYARAIDRALRGQASQAFRVGLCHRPSGFPDLAKAGIDLTLSGHTHAGQIGVGERSIFEGVAPDARLWGRYAIGASQLYTSSGGGHWFAFRLACPSEAALITLERA